VSFFFVTKKLNLIFLEERTAASAIAANVGAAWRRRGFTAARTGAKLANSHKLSGESLPRLRQTASWALAVCPLFQVVS